MSKYGIGQPVLRFEDPRLLRGQGRFINDVNLPGQAHAVFVRSPHAHATIRSIDVEQAKKAPGVAAAFDGLQNVFSSACLGTRLDPQALDTAGEQVIAQIIEQVAAPR